MSLADDERAFYLKALSLPPETKMTLADLKAAYLKAGIAGTLPGGGGAASNVVFIPKGGTVPAGLPDDTLVVEKDA